VDQKKDLYILFSQDCLGDSALLGRMRGHDILTVDINIKVYLEFHHKIVAKDISEFFSYPILRDVYDRATHRAVEVLNQMDSAFSAKTSTLNLKKLFKVTYSYFFSAFYFSTFLYSQVLEKLLKEKHQKVFVENKKISLAGMNIDLSFFSMTRDLFPDFEGFVPLDIKPYQIKHESHFSFSLKLFTLMVRLRLFLIFIAHFLYRFRFQSLSIFLICDGVHWKNRLYSLAFLKWFIKKENLVTLDHLELAAADVSIEDGVERAKNSGLLSAKSNIEKIAVNLFYQTSRSVFPTTITRLQNWLRKNQGVKVGVFASGPSFVETCLTCAVFLEKDVKIIGMQHGSGYGLTKSAFHQFLDYDKCNEMLTYGFSWFDLEKAGAVTSNEDTTIPSFIPVGNPQYFESNVFHGILPKRKIDIIFAPTIVSDFYYLVPISNLAHEITDAQIKIAEWLGTRSDLRSIVKTMRTSRPRCSPAEVFKDKSPSHVQWIDHLNFKATLSWYAPRIVVTDHFSTPIYESLNSDTEIFTIEDQMAKIHKDARDLLQKRVHLCQTPMELIEKLEGFLAGKILPLRNREFFDRYVYKKNSVKKTLDYFLSLQR